MANTLPGTGTLQDAIARAQQVLEQLSEPSSMSEGQIIVLKVGTSSLVLPEQGRFNLSSLARIVETVKSLHAVGHHCIIVTSGAVGVGCHRLHLDTKPTSLAQKQALAAIGQVHLMKQYEDMLETVGLTCAQVLVTLDNLAVRGQYLNVRNTFSELMALGVVPVVNENDCVSVQKLKFGDNDTLAAHVAAMVNANWLFLMTDVDFLYTANPKTDPAAEPIYEVRDLAQLCVDTSGGEGTQWGTGGMATKLKAAHICTAAGATMVILNAKTPENVVEVVNGAERVGTKIFPIENALRGRKRWILSVPPMGQLWLSAAAIESVRHDGESLFCGGVTQVVGRFAAHDGVQLCDAEGEPFAMALVNLASDVISAAVESHTSSASGPCCLAIDEVVFRDNVAVMSGHEQEHPGSGYLTPHQYVGTEFAMIGRHQSSLSNTYSSHSELPSLHALHHVHSASSGSSLHQQQPDLGSGLGKPASKPSRLDQVELPWLEKLATDEDAEEVKNRLAELSCAAPPDMQLRVAELAEQQRQELVGLPPLPGGHHHFHHHLHHHHGAGSTPQSEAATVTAP